MNIYNLGEIPAAVLPRVGGKAKGLNELKKHSFAVPAGFVILDCKTEKDIERAAEYWQSFGIKPVAVRSSATAEDGADFSFAGQFETVLNIKTKAEFEKAVQKCLASLNSVTGKNYADTAAIGGIEMCLVVQQMVDADTAGVCFSVSPNNKEEVLIESVSGLGESLVSGEATGKQLVFKRTEKTNNQIFNEILEIEKAFGFPVDCEWAVKDKKLWWLQCRPITTIDEIDEHELDTPVDLTGQIVTRCNVGEMLPGAVTPLTLSVTVAAIDWGMRKMTATAGVAKFEKLPAFSCVLPVCNHLFINLSSIYPMTKSVFLATKENVDVSLCGRRIDLECEIAGRKRWFGKRLSNTCKYFGFILSRNRARKRLGKMAEKFHIADSDDAQTLYNSITDNMWAVNKATGYHYVTSAHSGAMSSAALNILESKLHDIEKCKSILAELLENIDGIESVDILRSLRKIARAKDGDRQNAIDGFMTRHGHRAIREAELRSRGWKDDRASFDEYLRAVGSGAAEAEKTTVTDIKAILEKNGLRAGGALKFLIKQSRVGVSNRENSKSMMIKVYDEFKTAYRKLANLLTEKNIIPDEDLIFFFTHDELLTVINGGASALIKRAIVRRRLLDTQMNLSFAEVYLGKPEPEVIEIADTDAKRFKGVPISRGTATGKARVVKTMADAAKLQNGEIMVSVFTDIGWSPYYALIGGLVTEIGSALSHGAVVAREYGLPLVSNIKGATKIIKTGDTIQINGTTGEVAIIGG